MKALHALIAAALLASPAAAQETAPKRHEVPLAGSPSRGPADAPVTVVEFLDFQ